MTTCHHTPSMAGPVVCRQAHEVGAPRPGRHAGSFAGGAGKSAFLPQLRASNGQQPVANRFRVPMSATVHRYARRYDI